ncbi:T9SS C-terminal target domain-containing protein [Marinilabiliaceae bacterium JC017]|nr:T9SS C-terminal target domain-containing protein [Marinilabiliaceae bacterium JC017]
MTLIGINVLSNVIGTVVLSLVISYAMILFFQKIRSAVKLFLFFAVLVLLYATGKIFHLSSLLMILIFGLVLENRQLFFIGFLKKHLDEVNVSRILIDFKLLTRESAFVVRTFFFFVLGMSITLAGVLKPAILGLTAYFLIGLIGLRFVILKFFLKKNIFPQLFIAPRGLISILLFFSIPKEFQLSDFEVGILLLSIITTSILMAWSLVHERLGKMGRLKQYIKIKKTFKKDLNRVAMNKYFLMGVFALSLVSTSIKAQISYGGLPSQLETTPEYVTMPSLPVLMKAEVQDNNSVGPLTFAHPFFVNYSPDNSGQWTVTDDGTRVWRLGIYSKGAKSINLIFDRFEIPEGGKVFVYNPDRSVVLGAFTDLSNKSSGLFAIAPVPGDEVILEYQEEPEVSKKVDLLLSAVNHDYLGVYSQMMSKAGRFGDSCGWHPEVNCFEGKPDKISQSVCRIIVDGTELCSGTLLNNVKEDGTPYFLTAAHCLKKTLSAQSIVFYFNYETPECISFVEGTKMQTISGSSLCAQVDTMDFALVKMDEIPPAEFRPYYAGWTLSESPQGPSFAIHHPMGDVKKVAKDNESPRDATFHQTDINGNPFIKDGHWFIERWDDGTTEGGSSGCGLFNSDGLLIGSLSGGLASCSHPIEDYFARLNKMWDHLGQENAQLAHWLDPDNTGAKSMSGFDYYNEKVIRLSHLEKKDNVELSYMPVPEQGYWSGHNSKQIPAFAEYYNDLRSGKLLGVYLMAGKSTLWSNQRFNLKVWAGDESGPHGLLAEKKDIFIGNIKENRENLFMLNEQVELNGPFFVGIEINYDISTDTLALYQIKHVANSNSANSAYLLDGGQWKPYDQLYPGGKSGAYWIDLLVADADYIPTNGEDMDGPKVSVYPNPVRTSFTFQVKDTTLQKIKISDISGRVIKTKEITPGTTKDIIYLSGLPKGIYLVQFIFDSYREAMKIVYEGKAN